MAGAQERKIKEIKKSAGEAVAARICRLRSLAMDESRKSQLEQQQHINPEVFPYANLSLSFSFFFQRVLCISGKVPDERQLRWRAPGDLGESWIDHFQGWGEKELTRIK